MATARLTKSNTFRWRSLPLLAILVCWTTLVAQGQLLEPGVQLGDERYFLEGSEVQHLLPSGELLQLERIDELTEPKSLLQPEAWQDCFVVVGDEAAVLVRRDSQSVLFSTANGEEEKKSSLQAQIWGDLVLLHEEGSQVLMVVAQDGSSEKIEVEMVFEPQILDAQRLLVLMEGRYRVYHSQDLAHPEDFELPFSGADVKVALSGEKALIWSPTSTQAVVVGRQEPLTLTSPPIHGVKSLGYGEFILCEAANLEYFNRYGGKGVYSAPAVLNAENLDKAHFFFANKALHFLISLDPEGLVTMSFDRSGRISGGILGAEEIKSLIIPPPNSGQRPLLLTETTRQETKVEPDGRVVTDPKTGLEEKAAIKGHTLYMLSEFGQWRVVRNEPRARLVGPAQVVQGVLIFASQTEPQQLKGVKRKLNGAYPYPEVVVHAFNSHNGGAAWTLELPRGESPSAARIAEAAWPLLTKQGPILFTTEDDRLSALNPVTGTIEWTSSKLPLDESRPIMIRWDKTLGLVATNKTTKELIVFGNEGQVLESIGLSKFFNRERAWNLAGVVVICFALILYIYLAGKKKLFIRRIAGLEALDEAVGRATEMGKPVLYVTGLADVDDIQTLAALSILSHVAKKTAEYDTSILATTSRAVTFSAAQEVVRDAFTIAGRPDSFSVESVRYISDDQFGYAAGVDGMMVREQPAANFYMGKFYAESLIFAETGYATGAIQIAGTAQANQLPFFVAACDYTLIGEELFAASAYLSGDPLQVGSLRGQDVGKAIVMVVLVLASFDATLQVLFDWSFTSYLGALLS